MQVYSIRKRLNIPEYKITWILSETNTEIRYKVGAIQKKAIYLFLAVEKLTKWGSIDWKNP